MRKLLLSLLLLGGLVRTEAAPILYDSFNYSPAGEQVSNAGSAAWFLRNSPQIDPTIRAGSLAYPGLPTATGDNSVAFNGIAGSGIATRFLDNIYDITNTTAVYYSLTFQVASIATDDWGGAANWVTGAFMMGFTQDSGGALQNASAAAPLLIRTGDPTNSSGNANSIQQFQLGTAVTAVQSATNRIFDSTRNYAPGTTLFLVLSYTFGPDALDDVARLYVNPIPGSPESANVPVVTTTGNADVNNGQVQTFFLRNNSVQPESTIIDDLRVGTSWEDVTPVPEPSIFGLLILGAGGFLVRQRCR